MPELPEVETIVQGLNSLLKGQRIIDVQVREPALIAFPDLDQFQTLIRCRKVLNLSRRGKYILMNLDQGKTLVIHLRMTGRLLVKPREQPFDKHTHIIFQLEGNLDLRFHNVRKFGRLYLVDTGKWIDAGGLNKLGPEPLDEKFTIQDFTNRISKRHGKIKPLLLNQEFIAGLGNIYCDEALFRAGINPHRNVDTLSKKEINKLYQSIRQVLKESIELGGTTFRDYVNAHGESGNFQKKLAVYQKEGKECPYCYHPIVRDKIGGRSSYYCPECQK